MLAAAQGARRAAGRRIGVVTSSGGLAELILDIAGSADLRLPPLSAAAKEEIERRDRLCQWRRQPARRLGQRHLCREPAAWRSVLLDAQPRPRHHRLLPRQLRWSALRDAGDCPGATSNCSCARLSNSGKPHYLLAHPAGRHGPGAGCVSSRGEHSGGRRHSRGARGDRPAGALCG